MVCLVIIYVMKLRRSQASTVSLQPSMWFDIWVQTTVLAWNCCSDILSNLERHIYSWGSFATWLVLCARFMQTDKYVPVACCVQKVERDECYMASDTGRVGPVCTYIDMSCFPRSWRLEIYYLHGVSARSAAPYSKWSLSNNIGLSRRKSLVKSTAGLCCTFNANLEKGCFT